MTDPRLLEVARVSAGLTQGALAKALDKSQPFISQVERNERQIPEDLLPAWAAACKVPPSYFARHHGPLPEPLANTVHRRMKTLPAKPFSYANAHVELACMAVDSMWREIEINPAIDVPVAPKGIGPEDAAELVRRVWRIGDGPLPNLVDLVESAGIPVLLMDELHDKHSACSQRGRWFDWLIALNAGHQPSRRRFTLSHELGHIVLGHQVSSVMDDAEAKQFEREADSFASALLMPAAHAMREIRNPDLKRMVTLKQRWKVSVAFLIHRAKELAIINSDHAQWLYIELSTLPGGRRREPGEIEPEEPRLVRKVIQALEADGLSIGEIADLATMTEGRFRELFFGEVQRLRLAPERPARVQLTLERPI